MSDRISTPFDARSTAAEVIAGVDLTGRRAVVTGGASGIGVETARALAGAGAEVTLAGRNREAGERTAADITESSGNRQVLVAALDLADQASVAAFVAGWHGPLHVLVNNAGVRAAWRRTTPRPCGSCCPGARRCRSRMSSPGRATRRRRRCPVPRRCAAW